MKMSPDAIDVAVIQLRSIFAKAPDGTPLIADIPDDVREKGNTFIDALDEWSETLKAKK
jgi:hypothetical protein